MPFQRWVRPGPEMVGDPTVDARWRFDSRSNSGPSYVSAKAPTSFASSGLGGGTWIGGPGGAGTTGDTFVGRRGGVGVGVVGGGAGGGRFGGV